MAWSAGTFLFPVTIPLYAFAGGAQWPTFLRIAAFLPAAILGSHLGAPIVVGPLRPAHAYELLTAPMAAMGFTFDSDMTVARALAYANNGPAQLQLLGAALVEHMSRKRLGPRRLTRPAAGCPYYHYKD